MRSWIKTLVATVGLAVGAAPALVPGVARAGTAQAGAGATRATQAGTVQATSTSKTVHLGKVTATVIYTTDNDGDVNSEQLAITRGGKLVFLRSVSNPNCGGVCPNFGGIRILRLQASSEPDVVLNQYTGGAHCCTIAQVYSYRPRANTYKLTSYDFGDPGYLLRKLHGKYVFYTGDDSFAYEFTDYAGSAMPVKLMAFTSTGFRNVTRKYPALIRADAAGWMMIYKGFANGGYDDSVGVAAAWAADEEELGNATAVAGFLKQQVAYGHLNSASPELGPSGAKFVKELYGVLRRDGYMR